MYNLKNPPQIIIHYLKDTDGPDFLKVRHLLCQLEFPNGELSKEFTHDVVMRKSTDACVICAYDLSEPNNPKIWLRSCIRISVAARSAFPNSNGCGWELPAGLIDGDEDPLDTCIRELEEEVGIKASKDKATILGNSVWGSIGFSGEKLFYYCVDVTGLEVGKPSEDGTPQEQYGECILVPLNDISDIKDMKTDLGIMRLKNYFNSRSL